MEAGGSNPLWDATNTANAVFFVLNQYNQFLHKSVKVVSGTGTKEDPYILTGKPGIVAMLNGVEQSYEQKPIEKDGQVLVPLRAVFESLGAEVGWEEGTQMVTVTKDKEQVKIQVGSKVMEKNGEEIDFGYPAVLEGGRTMIPLSAVSESFSIPVDWNRDEQRIDITAETETE